VRKRETGVVFPAKQLCEGPGGVDTRPFVFRCTPADGDDARALCAGVQAFSGEFAVDVELQWREAVLGRVRSGVPDGGLEEALAEVTGET